MLAGVLGAVAHADGGDQEGRSATLIPGAIAYGEAGLCYMPEPIAQLMADIPAADEEDGFRYKDDLWIVLPITTAWPRGSKRLGASAASSGR